jgi:hypothetical protein
MNSCPECNADKKYNYTEPLGGDVVGFFCGAVTIRLCPGNEPIMRKKCDYRPPDINGLKYIGVDLASGPDHTVCINPDTGLPEDVKLATREEIRESLEELYKRNPLDE